MYHPIRFAAACIVVLGLMAWTLPDAQAQARERTHGRTSTESSRTERSTARTTDETTRQREAARSNDREARTRTGRRSDDAATPSPDIRRDAGRSSRSGTRTRERDDRVDQRRRSTTGRTDQRDRDPRSTPPRADGRYDRGRNDRDDRGRRDRDGRDRGRYYRSKPVIVRPGGGVKVYVGRPHVRVRPVVDVHIDIAWPWEYRHRHGWSPRYEYRQVVYVDAGWGHHRRVSELDVRTIYRHRVRQANHRYAVVEIDIERIELYEDGYFVGEVRHIPSQLSRVQGTLYRDGRVRFDRSVFLVGDPHRGFEMISTRYYDRYILDAYRPSHGYRVGVLDLRRERVVPVRYSRLFDPYDFDGYVPISLLPEERGWLCDYGEGAVSYYRYEDDWDDYGYYYGYGNRDGEVYRQQHVAPRAPTDGRATLTTASEPPAFPMLRQEKNRTVETDQGARITLNRTVEIRRLE